MTFEEYLQLGFGYVREKIWSQAVSCFTSAERLYEGPKKSLPASLDSYLGLSIAMSEGDINEALRRCERGLDRASYQPEFYFNLGKVYLKAKEKDKAIQVLQLGLALDEQNPKLKKEMKRLGIRKAPALEFLPRGNFINKCLGRVKRRVKTPK